MITGQAELLEMTDDEPTNEQMRMFGNSPFNDVLKALEAKAKTKREKGDMFETLTKAFLEQDSLYKEQFSKVWFWNDWPLRAGRPETGVDLVAENADDGEYTAIQCKFYAANEYISKKAVDTFISASGIVVTGGPRFTKRLFISTTSRWSQNAEEALLQEVPIARLGIADFENSSIDWTKYDIGIPARMIQREKKSPREHQREAILAVLNGFQTHDRGKMIMACGTGKTFTALRIAEQQTKPGDIILFLAPSITLISQSMREWGNEATEPMRVQAVCSDTKVSRVGDEDSNDTGRYDIVAPATTDAETLLKNVQKSKSIDRRTVIFSTYQSLDVIREAQARGMNKIALVICDEAHRTTGVTLATKDESYFVMVHSNDHIKADKRLYMTATPKIYGQQSMNRAAQANATLTSMDDGTVYGPEFYRFTFAQAVEAGQLCDYRVLVFGVDESAVAKGMQAVMAGGNLSLNDAGKMLASWNAMAKLKSEYEQFEQDPDPMQSVVAFAGRIRESKEFATAFNELTQNFQDRRDERTYTADHVDGNHNALVRARKLEWLGDGSEECHILSNARCLTEGVDVPALDAILFLSPRSSQIDVVQAVGRAMRRSDGTGKRFGYIIIPITVPAQENYEEVILDSRYNPTFQVLQALKSHDEDFYDTINQVDLRENKKISVAIFTDDSDKKEKSEDATDEVQNDDQATLNLEVTGQIREALFARIVDSLTDKHYYAKWAEETARINAQYEERIRGLLDSDNRGVKTEFREFHASLQRELNNGITEGRAISLLAQHLVTKPVFDALFSEFQFVNQNPVAQAMEGIVEKLKFEHGTDSETKELEGFYKSIQRRIRYVDTAEKKQRIIADLYREFFEKAFPKDAKAMGMIYTPTEAVDFLVRSVEEILNEEFNTSLTYNGVSVLDPFTGTGTFITRMISSGLIEPEDLTRKYTKEIHANEITLLAYYIASINIEMTFHDMSEQDQYMPFRGIVFADSFEAGETRVAPRLKDDFFATNNERMILQNEKEIRVIIGNPPWSVGQREQNDDNQNRTYPRLRARISETYQRASAATKNRRNLYDKYVHAIRMASDRIHESKDGGVLAFVTNGGFIDSNSFDGFRRTILREFNKVYCFNLRGAARGAGETRRREKGNIFGSGTRTAVAILIMVKKPQKTEEMGKLLYYDIGDYLTEKDKLDFLKDRQISSIPWEQITPDEHHDWTRQREEEFESLIPLYGENAIFKLNSLGVGTNRDAWVYGFSKEQVKVNCKNMMESFNGQIPTTQPVRDPTKFSWTRKTLRRAKDGRKLEFNGDKIIEGQYRPFTKQMLYFDRSVNEETFQQEHFYPTPHGSNMGIAISDKDQNKEFSCLMTNRIPDLELVYHGQYLPRWTYEKNLLGNGRKKVSNINPEVLATLRQTLETNSITEDDLFYYVYAILHHEGYRTKYATNLRKEPARIPLPKSLQDFRKFVSAGEALADLHVNYEDVELYQLEEAATGNLDAEGLYKVSTKKMRHPSKGDETDRSTLIYNDHITLKGIPEKAHEYTVGQYSALGWLIDRFHVTTHNNSGIVRDPNNWAEEHGNPRYIIDLIKRVVTVSVKTVDIVGSLPKLPGA